MSTLHVETIATLAPKIENKELSPVELTKGLLARIERVDKKINSYITVMDERALADAKKAEQEMAQGNYRGPLHGVPIALKDLIYTKGVLTTSGSQVLSDHIPEEDAMIVTKLREAGAVIVGKLNMHEFAFGVTNENDYYGNANNPWDVERTPGGSSGGNGAAVAAGLAYATIGSDTGGSIRIPSAFNGICGLKPTYGRVTKHGVIPLSWSLDHLGPMARNVEDLAIVLNAIAGYDSLDPTTAKVAVPDYLLALDKEVNGLTIGVPTNYFFDFVEEEVEQSVKAAIAQLEQLGANIVDISIPELDLCDYSELVTIQAEAATYHVEMLREKSELYGNDVRTTLQAAQLLTAVEYLQAQQARRVIQEAMARTFEQVDVIVAPSVPFVAPKWKESFKKIDGVSKAVAAELVRLAAPANLTGIPSISVPTGLSSEGLPIAMQIMGKPFAEETLFAIASAYEKASNLALTYPLD